MEVVKLGSVRKGSIKGKQNPYTTTISKTNEEWKRSLVAFKHKHDLKSDVDILSHLWNRLGELCPNDIPTEEERSMVQFGEDGRCYISDVPIENIETVEDEDSIDEESEDEEDE